ncbi:unnamed protein product [Pseudo-nitzschia multistriata]|uniref:Uncharacterized protein n=1 Tax=Pseudo-nitzschia multistriata TaxID=183589 RepID=A0A448ZL68_9STRA|nr:unnamed protein product [Pseudo-nitzschia multistriata]
MTSCHDSSSSLDDQNDRGRSIAKGGVTTPFPWKLHIMLDTMDETGEKSIVHTTTIALFVGNGIYAKV